MPDNENAPPAPAPRMSDEARAVLREIVHEEFMATGMPALERWADLYLRRLVERLEARFDSELRKTMAELMKRLMDQDDGETWKHGADDQD